MDIREQYSQAAAHALAGFQLIEERIKEYLEHYYDSVRILLNGRLAFSYSRDEINEAPLERLTNIFAKTTGNEDLVRRVRALIKHRNEIAHKALVYMYGDRKTEQELDASIPEFIALSESLLDIMDEIHRETVAVIRVVEDSSHVKQA